LSAFNADNLAAGARGIGLGIAIWIILTWAVAIFLGGMFASWFDARADQTVGALHGVCVWGLAITVSALVLSGVVMRSAPRQIAGASGIEMGMQSGLRLRPTAADALIATQALVLQTNAQMDRQLATAVATATLRGDAAGAKELLSASGASADDADRTLQRLAPVADRYRVQARVAAASGARNLAKALWVTLLTLLIALVTGILGGSLGAGHLHRVYHLRHF
jgi:hypothetical protein